MRQPIRREDWWKDVRWKIAESTGWSLGYIDNLSMGDIWEWLSVRDGNAKADAAVQRDTARRRKGKRR